MRREPAKRPRNPPHARPAREGRLTDRSDAVGPEAPVQVLEHHVQELVRRPGHPLGREQAVHEQDGEGALRGGRQLVAAPFGDERMGQQPEPVRVFAGELDVGSAGGPEPTRTRSPRWWTVPSARCPGVGPGRALERTGGTKRLIVVSALGGRGSSAQQTRLARWGYRRAVGGARFAEVDRQEELVTAAGIPATVVRPPRLDDQPTSGHRVITGTHR